MNDCKSVPVTTLTLYALWGWVLCSLITGWTIMAAGHLHVAIMFGFTSCASGAVAVAVTGRYNASRVCQLLRNLHGLDGEQAAASLHTVH